MFHVLGRVKRLALYICKIIGIRGFTAAVLLLLCLLEYGRMSSLDNESDVLRAP